MSRKMLAHYSIKTDDGTYYGADNLSFKKMGGQQFLDGFCGMGCRTFINTANIVSIEDRGHDEADR